MQSFTFQFPAGKINAALLFAGKNDFRYYLNGVMFTKAPDGKGIIAVATDGHRLCAIYHAQDVAQLPADFNVIIHRDELQTIGKAPIKVACGALDLVFAVSQVQGPNEEGITTIGRPHVTMKGAVSVECDTIDGKFPDWQRIIPRTFGAIEVRAYKSDEPAQAYVPVDAAYLADYAKAAKALGGKCTGISFGQAEGGSAFLVRIANQPDFVSVLMSMREDAPTVPEWLSAPAADLEAPYAERVAKLEADGLTTSDAQAAVAAEDMRKAA